MKAGPGNGAWRFCPSVFVCAARMSVRSRLGATRRKTVFPNSLPGIWFIAQTVSTHNSRGLFACGRLDLTILFALRMFAITSDMKFRLPLPFSDKLFFPDRLNGFDLFSRIFSLSYRWILSLRLFFG